MLKCWVLVCVALGLSGTAHAQAEAEIAKEAARHAKRALDQYDNVIANRGMFEKAYDAVGHRTYDLVKQSREDVVAAKAAVDKLLAAGKSSEAEAKIDEVKAAGDRMEDAFAAWRKDSAAMFEKVMIGGGILVLVLGGVVGLIVRKKRQRKS